MSNDREIPNTPGAIAPETVVTPEAAAPATVTVPQAAVSATSTADVRVSIDDFMKIEIRAARVLSAERVPKSRKLMKLEVDLGTERRVLVAGIAEAYEPDGLVGRVVAVVVNLMPATLMGIQSNGMILAANHPGGQPIVVTFEKEPVLGSRIK